MAFRASSSTKQGLIGLEPCEESESAIHGPGPQLGGLVLKNGGGGNKICLNGAGTRTSSVAARVAA